MNRVASIFREVRFVATVSILLLLASSMTAQGPRPFQDSLLDHLVGHWNVTGTRNGRPMRQTINSEWVLNHQFLQVLQKQDPAAGNFQASFYIGNNPGKQQLAAHLLTTFGGGDAPIGSGEVSGNEFSLTFPRPKGVIAYRFVWQPESKSWHIVATNAGNPFLDLTAVQQTGGGSAN